MIIKNINQKMQIKTLLNDSSINNKLKFIAEKIHNNQRITTDEGLYLYETAELNFLGILANYIKEKRHGEKVFFNKNFHIEPTNICIYQCKFCSYSRKKNEKDAWKYSFDEMLEIAKKYQNTDVTEVHIVGGVYPNRDLFFYVKLLEKIKQILPKIHIKAFTAVEIDYMCKKANLSIADGLIKLKEFGLDSMPGGGAEILNNDVRKQICHEKSDSNSWLKIHRTAHELNIPTNATILYGHVEKYKHRIEHLNKLRQLQDETKGFQTFIPLKYRNSNNKLSYLQEVSVIEDLRNFAISRIFLDNFAHIKAYWVMLGKETAQMSLNYGVDDLDGTIDDTTKIYTMATDKAKKPTMTTTEIKNLILAANKKPVERNTLYKEIKS